MVWMFSVFYYTGRYGGDNEIFKTRVLQVIIDEVFLTRAVR